MFKTTLCAAAAAFLVMADTAKADTYILVSCYRGPWTEVIWDKANPNFVDSLVQAGYSPQEATSIANYICRDPRLVDNPIALAKEVRSAMANAPRG
ncbi:MULTISPECIES: hypothetical protein [Roseovarius]|uniref:hypothetical protein n=1 Tax=Roseovarius TaxID=74030 RepID=UPI001C9688D4|nr:hypothetical protein [Roseovarius atlanticus]MBY5987634.1 hypothetical protein [Roseovarius atlanticus]MBY6123025.1 hypothetical protein [Roseovarius atlanticus]MBY6147521.1 hypothetical protein [Roseovarius atlanticus]